MPDIIKLLPDSVANQIAAGEVIQRPASVVKELMENSVDAGASDIKVIVKDAGRTLIQVVDDGIGMSETDARLAFERHSTSKISCAEDLYSITTKGFRGEALASIAAVAMVELRTKRKEDETGTLVVINGSKVERQEVCTCPAGANFLVKSLFFNIPARRKFLKSDNTELRNIINEFQKVALSNPAIRFSLYHNDSEIYILPPGNIKQRITGIFGKNISQELLNIEADTALAKISGFIGKPESAKKTSGGFFFANGRFIRHPYLHKAVMEGYQKILPPDSVPSYFIFIDVDPSKIDVNIHPTKTEVKFEDERAIWQILLAAVRETLGRFNIIPSIDFGSDSYVDIPVRTDDGRIPVPPEIKIVSEYNPFAGDDRPSKRELIEKFEKERVANWEKLYPEQQAKADIRKQDEEKQEVVTGWKRFMQVKGRYIVCPVKSGLMFIDQKRAHERILYEQFIMDLDRKVFSGQKSVFPETLEMDAADYYLLKEIEDELRLLGYDFEDKGNYRVIIISQPVITGCTPAAEFLRSLIGTFRSLQTDVSGDIKEKVAEAMAKSASIPYGTVLLAEEMEQLIDRLFACRSPNYSPSGKPVVSILTTDEIDKRFK